MNKPSTFVMKPILDNPPGSRLSHVADHQNRYPGEIVQFSTLLHWLDGMQERRLSIFLSKGLELRDYIIQDTQSVKNSYARETEDGLIIDFILSDSIEPQGKLEVITRANVLPIERDGYLTGKAESYNAEGYLLESERLQIFVKTQSSYMRYLPEIYNDNDFLSHFLMLMESFWQPIEAQIGQADNYYDPDLTPEQFLPWLASWIGVVWDEHLPISRKRTLLRMALSIYQYRGTRKALYDVLKIYTGGEVGIIEHRTQNFILGSHAPLGHMTALGKHNFPHTFTVNLRVPAKNIFIQPGTAVEQAEDYYRNIIENLIESQKPASTAFRLNLEII